MNTHSEKTNENKCHVAAANIIKQQGNSTTSFSFLDGRTEAVRQKNMQDIANSSPQVKGNAHLQAKSDNGPRMVTQREQNSALFSTIERQSGYAMDDVRVNYHSNKLIGLLAHNYAQVNEIHFGAGQGKHFQHEAQHVVQQKQNRFKPIKLTNDSDKTINGLIKTSSIIQKVPWDPVAAGNEAALGAIINAPAIPGTHPTQIGANPAPVVPGVPPQTAVGERHFDQRLLNLIESVLTSLPSSHVKGNASLARVVLRQSMGPAGAGMASFYQPGTQSLNIVVPFDASSWTYMQVEKWPFGDSVTTLLSEIDHVSEQWTEYQGGNITGTDFLKEAISAPGRFLTHNVTTTGSTLDKVKQSLSTEGFLKWIIRHETGHSVDDAIGWHTNHHYQTPACGGWQEHIGGLAEANMVAEILNTTGLTPMLGNLNAAYNPHTAGAGYTSMLDAVTNRRKQDLKPAFRNAALTTFEGTNPGGRRLVNYAENVIKEGLGRPWEHGGSVNVGGRAYHRDTQHDNWVSYIHARYANRNSNYQFQNPPEWFAESYQVYFKGQPADWGQNLKEPLAVAWFNANLVPAALGGGGLLINGLGDLINIAGPAPAVVVPAAGTAAIPTPVEKFVKAVGKIALNVVKVPFDLAMGLAAIPFQIVKKIPPVNWALRWLGF